MLQFATEEPVELSVHGLPAIAAPWNGRGPVRVE